MLPEKLSARTEGTVLPRVRLDEFLPAGPERLWFFGEAGRPVGPFPEEVLRRMLQSGEIDPDTGVWADGLFAWVPASAVADLVPDGPTALRAEQLGAWSPTAGVTRRAVARLVDSIPGPLAGLVIVWAVATAHEPWRRAGQALGGALLGLFASALVEAALLARFGTSPGKFLLALRVRTARQARPPFSVALWRSLGAWWFGLGAGVPLITPFSAIASVRDVLRRGSARWDRTAGLRVEQRAFVTRRAPRRWARSALAP